MFRILHISDSHLPETLTDKQLASFDGLYNAFTPLQPMPLLICFTGDLANSGTREEYEVAATLLDEFRRRIELDGHITYMICVPGNHDCHLPKENDDLRALSVQAIQSKAQKTSYLEQLSAQQDGFFVSQKILRSEKVEWNGRHHFIHRIKINNVTVEILGLNTAMCSTRNEVYGQLIVDPGRLPLPPREPDLTIGMLHHPFEWLCESVRHDAEKKMSEYSDIILYGHQHKEISRGITYLNQQSFHCSAKAFLAEGVPNGFSIIEVLPTNKAIYRQYSSEGTLLTTEPRELRKPSERTPTLKPVDGYIKQLMTPVAKINHPSHVEPMLNDFYVWPVARALEFKNEGGNQVRPISHRDENHRLNNAHKSSSIAASISCKEILDKIKSENRILVIGDDNSGKSSLLNMLFIELSKRGYYPLRLDGNKFKNYKKLEEYINSALEDQYGIIDRSEYRQTSYKERIILIDDFDQAGLHKDNASISDLVKELGSIVIAVASETHLLSEPFLKTDKDLALWQFSCWKIIQMSVKQRLELIEKWVRFNNSASEAEVQVSISATEQHVSRSVESCLTAVSAAQVMLILQTRDTKMGIDVAESGFQFEFLVNECIKLSLQEFGKGKPIKEDDIKYVLSRICRYLRSVSHNEIDRESLVGKIEEWKNERLASYDSNAMLEILTSSRLLKSRGSRFIEVSQKYVLYYGLAYSLRLGMHEGESSSELLEEYLSNLHLDIARDVLSTYMYLSKDRSLLNRVMKMGDETFHDSSEDWTANKAFDGTFGSDVLVLPSERVEENRVILAEQQDQDGPSVNVDDSIENIRQFTSAVNLVHLMGQALRIMRNSISSEDILDYGSRIVDCGNRSITFFLKLAESDNANIRTYVAALGRPAGGGPITRFQENLLEFLDRIAVLGAFSMVKRVAFAIADESFHRHVPQLSSNCSLEGKELVKIAVELGTLRKLKTSSILEVGRKLQGDKYLPFEVLRFLVWEHLLLFPSDRVEREKIGGQLRIDVRHPKVIGRSDKLKSG